MRRHADIYVVGISQESVYWELLRARTQDPHILNAGYRRLGYAGCAVKGGPFWPIMIFCRK